jgi:hypothetical protein
MNNLWFDIALVELLALGEVMVVVHSYEQLSDFSFLCPILV